uniref:RNA-polymerase II-associated protein 3-like C-terminal domain-containing protein n=1 Tax=Salix viminalis TaxID=40686 RepID=A0A6N2L1R1_SALVM
MARAPGKHGRDQALDWELLKDTDKKMKKKSQASDLIGEDGRSKGKTSAADSSRSGSGQYDYSRNFGAINHLSSSFTTDEVSMDATSEKELKKFNEAIECYSRSIALSPTAVAHANRVSKSKGKSFLSDIVRLVVVVQKAEDDCTEALNLDDHYIKAYSRRATARKELGKLKESIEDSGFALKLEPNNQEIKKQHSEVKSLYEKASDYLMLKASGTLRSSLQGAQKGGRSEASVNGHAVHQVSNATQRTGVSASKKDNTKENDGNYLVKKSVYVKELRNKGTCAGSKSDGQVGNDSPANATPNSNVESVQALTLPFLWNGIAKNNRTRRQELKTSVIELASQAASRAMAEAAKNITPPNTAYQFEVSWRGFSGDRALQTHLLKATSPSALPQIFKNALSVPILNDIIKRVASFFIDDMDLAVKYLENLTKVPRFGVLIMCLSSTSGVNS